MCLITPIIPNMTKIDSDILYKKKLCLIFLFFFFLVQTCSNLGLRGVVSKLMKMPWNLPHGVEVMMSTP